MTLIRKTASPVPMPRVRSFGILHRTGGASVASLYDARRRAEKAKQT